MNKELQVFLNKFDELSVTDKELLMQQLDVRTFPKSTVLLKQDQLCTACYFILKGCIRQFHLHDEEEITTAFYTEEEAVVLFNHYNKPLPSEHTLICVEECVLIVGTPKSETDLYTKFPKLAEITRNMMAVGFGKTQEALSKFITSSPEERYQHLLETKPNLLQRVPLHQLASFLGVTPESLSRIRKRIAKK